MSNDYDADLSDATRAAKLVLVQAIQGEAERHKAEILALDKITAAGRPDALKTLAEAFRIVLN